MPAYSARRCARDPRARNQSGAEGIHIGPLARGAAQTPGLCHHVTAAGGILALFDALPQAVEILETGGGFGGSGGRWPR